MADINDLRSFTWSLLRFVRLQFHYRGRTLRCRRKHDNLYWPLLIGKNKIKLYCFIQPHGWKKNLLWCKSINMAFLGERGGVAFNLVESRIDSFVFSAVEAFFKRNNHTKLSHKTSTVICKYFSVFDFGVGRFFKSRNFLKRQQFYLVNDSGQFNS